MMNIKPMDTPSQARPVATSQSPAEDARAPTDTHNMLHGLFDELNRQQISSTRVGVASPSSGGDVMAALALATQTLRNARQETDQQQVNTSDNRAELQQQRAKEAAEQAKRAARRATGFLGIKGFLGKAVAFAAKAASFVATTGGLKSTVDVGRFMQSFSGDLAKLMADAGVLSKEQAKVVSGVVSAVGTALAAAGEANPGLGGPLLLVAGQGATKVDQSLDAQVQAEVHKLKADSEFQATLASVSDGHANDAMNRLKQLESQIQRMQKQLQGIQEAMDRAAHAATKRLA